MHTTEVIFFPSKNKTYFFLLYVETKLYSVWLQSENKSHPTNEFELKIMSKSKEEKKMSLNDVIIYGNETNT